MIANLIQTNKKIQAGFALPTIVIATVVLFMILVAVVGAVSSTRVALDNQYYDALARDAAESGVSQAQECLSLNNYTATWSDTSPLRPNTNCSGGAACTDVAKCYVVKTPTYASTYSVGVVTDGGTGTQTFKVSATVSLLRKSDGSIAKTYSKTMGTQVGSQISTTNVVFGYTLAGSGGAQFATIGRDGVMRAAGYNAYGQLGNGTTTDSLKPTKFQAPTSRPIVAGFSNFLSIGWSMYALDNAGTAYGAGWNDHGQIGSGTTNSTTYVTTPQQVVIPGGAAVQAVIPGDHTNYFLTTDGNIYASGWCGAGLLGNNYTISGCSDQALPVRVNLPTPNTSDPNTLPTTNIVTDRYTTYVRMQGGRVYGWGDDENGELGDNAYTPHSSPVKIGTYGDSGSPTATQVAFDGNSVYILDSTGKMNGMGFSTYGQRGNRMASIYNPNTNHCMDNKNNDGATIWLYTCNASAAQKFLYRSDSSIYDPYVGKCLDNANADGVTLRLYTCNGTAAQKYTWDPWAAQFSNPNTGKCIDNANQDGATLQLYTCNNTAAQNYAMTTTWLEPFSMSGISGQITQITTDQWHVSVLTTNGEVWSAGLNSSGMFGAGSSNTYQPDPVKFQLPAGVTGKYIYATNASSPTNYVYQNLMVIGSDGKVYGAGSNTYGQLGNGTTASQQKTPVAMNVIDGVNVRGSNVQVGYGTAVIFTDSGRVYTVGNNDHGQLGDGTTTNRSTPYLSKFINASSPTQY